MRTFIVLGTILAVGGVVFLFTSLWHDIRGTYMEEQAVRAERLFRSYGDNVFRLAQKIEWGDALTPSDIAPVQDRINDRFGEEITFLFHALGSANLPAIDALIGAGADVTMDSKTTPSPDFVSALSKPGGPLIDAAGITELVRIYLRHGGDPNYYIGSEHDRPLVAATALYGNLDSVRVLLEAGANPWANVISETGREDNMMTAVNLSYNHFAFIDELIDQSYFDQVPQARLEGFLHKLSSYAQRGDEISSEIQRIAKRVLKRNPHYVESSDRLGTARIFKNHWNDPGTGVIPWDEIKSDSVK